MRVLSLQKLSAKVVKAREDKLTERLNTEEYLETSARVPLIKKLESDLGYCGFGDNRHQLEDENVTGGGNYLNLEDSQDIPANDIPIYTTIINVIPCATDDQYQNLKIFFRQLTANWFCEVKLCHISENRFASLVTYPAHGLVYFYYNVSPAFVMVQDLNVVSQCGESKAIMIMQAVQMAMDKFNFGTEFLENPVQDKGCKEFVEKTRMWHTSRTWKAMMPLMLPENNALSTIRKAKVSEVYRTLVRVAHLTSKREVTLTSREISDRPHKRHFSSEFFPENSKQLAAMERDIFNLKETVRSSRKSLCESESNHHETAVSVKSVTRTTSANEMKIHINTLQEKVLGLEEELKKSQQKFEEAASSWKKMEAHYKDKLVFLTKKSEDAQNKAKGYKEKLENREEYLNEVLNDYGCALVERDKLAREMKSRKTANSRTTSVCSTSCQTSPIASAQATSSTSSEETEGAEAVTEGDEQVRLSHRTREEHSESNVTSIQQSREESKISLSNIPTTAVERSLYNNYKMLVLTIADLLLSSDVAQLKAWVFSKFSINAESLNVGEIFLELDRKEVISAFDMRKLLEFFEGILNIQVVHMIDCFLVGDYSPLRYASHIGIFKKHSRGGNGNPSVVTSQTGTVAFRNAPRGTPQTAVPKLSSSSLVIKPNVTEVEEAYVGRKDSPGETSLLPSNCRRQEVRTTQQAVHAPLVVTDGSPNSNVTHGVTLGLFLLRSKSNVSNSSAALTRPQPQVDWGSNGKKLSKFQRPVSPGKRITIAEGSADDHDDNDNGLDDDSQWLCNHYKRRCFVKFDCCNKFWPCHRCHNNESKCGETKLKSCDTKFVKCVKCGREQPFGANSQYCSNCHLKFAKYFCEICKHLTGTDDNPYHCEKCGICRIHGDRSFHCDVCGVCLDVQLRGNHKCRAGSAHDECCICLEDAFTGCQILPCSHKVHKECATRMIRSGITRCPVCRESFAHKLERRNLPPSKGNK